jgi:hypothetical protein
MKPLEGNFIQNALKHGVAGLNIDGARISANEVITNHSRGEESAKSKGKYGDSAKQETHQTVGQQSGRWPSNVLLGHLEGCKRVGIKKVKGNHGDLGVYHGDTRSWKNQSVEGINRIGYADAEGKETVDAWDCQEGCPVKAMDEQSGVTTSGAMKRRVGAYDGESVTTFLRGDSGPHNQHGDTGGASRFFKQVKGD